MSTHSIRFKALVLSIVFILCVVIVPYQKISADSFPSEFYVNSGVYYSSSELFLAYSNLNYNQKEICAYILGFYNLMYLGSRGFAFRQGAYRNESEFIAKVKSFGYRFLQGAAEIALKSRMDDVFCKYASACILYASQCNNVTFDTWLDNLDENFVIPVDQGILNSFTLLYNDNDSLSISLEGDTLSEWEFGVLYDFAFENNVSAAVMNQLNDLLSDYDYFFFSNVRSYNDGGDRHDQYFCMSNNMPDVLFIQRNGSNYQNFAFGHFYGSDWHRLQFETYTAYQARYYTSSGNCEFDRLANNVNFNRDAYSTSQFDDLSEFVYYISQNYTPVSTQSSYFIGCYPYIRHVVLVDNLMTLENAEEVFNVESWDIIGLSDNMIVPIDTVEFKPKVITSINLPDNTQVQVPIQQIIYDPEEQTPSVIDPDTQEPVSPWQITIVVQPNETNPISVDVNLFSSAKVYVDYIWNSSIKFLTYCKQLLDCVGFDDQDGGSYGPKIAIFGVVTLGIAGGLIAKFLL